jgi:hypothetical protein
MRNVYEVLQEKESAAQRISREIEILQLAAPLLTDEAPSADAMKQDASSHDASSHDASSRDAPSHDAPAEDDYMPVAPTQNASAEDSLAQEHLIASDPPAHEEVPTEEVQIEEAPIDYLPSHEIHENDADTRIVSGPSLLTNESTDVESGRQDEANSVPEKKISGRLKRLVRPFVSFVAG